MARDVIEVLRERGITPTAQRVVIAEYLLGTTDHPSADQVWERVAPRIPVLSRATVYNTLNLFVEKGLVRSFTLTEGKQVFDPNVERHHHFIDEETGAIYDVPWDALSVRGIEDLEGYEIDEHMVVLRGRRRAKKKGA